MTNEVPGLLSENQEEDTRISNEMKDFVKKMRIEAGKIGLKNSFSLEKCTILLSLSEDKQEGVEMTISKNLKYISFCDTRGNVKHYNKFILDFIDVLTVDFNYWLVSSGFHSGSNSNSNYQVNSGSIWAILEKKIALKI